MYFENDSSVLSPDDCCGWWCSVGGKRALEAEKQLTTSAITETFEPSSHLRSELRTMTSISTKTYSASMGLRLKNMSGQHRRPSMRQAKVQKSELDIRK